MTHFSLSTSLGAFAVASLLGITVPAWVNANEVTPPVLMAQRQTLTEAQVKNLLATLRTAEDAEDIEQLKSLLAPFIVSEITVESGANSTTQVMEGISSHSQLWEAIYRLIESQDLLNEKTEIRFVDDGKMAVVTRFSVETLTLTDQRQMMALAKDVIRIALIDGEPKIVSVKTNGWLESRPSDEE